MIDWIVYYPIQAGFIGLGLGVVYFIVLHCLEKKYIKKSRRKTQGASFYVPMDIAPTEYFKPTTEAPQPLGIPQRKSLLVTPEKPSEVSYEGRKG